MLKEITESLQSIINEADGFVELRYARKTNRTVVVERGRVENAEVKGKAGVGVRVIADGTWGFSSTGSTDDKSVRSAIDRAREAARASGSRRTAKLPDIPATDLAVGDFTLTDTLQSAEISFEEKVELARRGEAEVRSQSALITSATCAYNEIDEEKAILTTDGACASFRLIRPEFRVQAIAGKSGELSSANESVGVTGDWECLFSGASTSAMAERAAQSAIELMNAPMPKGGRTTVILAPSIVGLLVHEAIGHTVEADFVQSGSVANGMMGKRVGSELVTLCDSGASEFYPGAGGTIPVDDEGVLAGRTTIIREGILNSYLHNRESAAHFGVAPTGNARAWDYSDQPLIRMRNTYLCPGESSLEEMIAGVEDGYLIDGPRNGQADATGEFMFAVQTARRILDGKLGELVRGVTISGVAFEVMQTVDAISSEFKWDLGSGYCGKGQPAKVDAGGPHVRCQVLLGGVQS